ncbi:uncharacterized protein LOC106177381 [Lingula anatina]|uniref:Uncharacterized protein LOC106177381 n=1 Tax=Lingula anatina TaxID=7574 RepID=A0A1S3JZY8_LINAN|nr:uncharacterized protein LOC106177381 [Lingula anatina]|eukprot:XP_013415591.1 uncharacterized protein LOC106177381 [Lingula anatina]
MRVQEAAIFGLALFSALNVLDATSCRSNQNLDFDIDYENPCSVDAIPFRQRRGVQLTVFPMKRTLLALRRLWRTSCHRIKDVLNIYSAGLSANLHTSELQCDWHQNVKPQGKQLNFTEAQNIYLASLFTEMLKATARLNTVYKLEIFTKADSGMVEQSICRFSNTMSEPLCKIKILLGENYIPIDSQILEKARKIQDHVYGEELRRTGTYTALKIMTLLQDLKRFIVTLTTNSLK